MQPSIDHCERRIYFPYRTIEGWMNGGFELCQCAARILFCVWRKAACASNSPICVFNPRNWIFNRCDWNFNPRLWGSVFRFWAPNSSYIYVISIPRKMFQPFSGQSFCSDTHRKMGWRVWFLNPSARFSRGTEERAWAVELLCLFQCWRVWKVGKSNPSAFFRWYSEGKVSDWRVETFFEGWFCVYIAASGKAELGLA